jgi:spore coat-associated protein N
MNNKRKILVPLATLLAAGAVAVGSGATFTSESHNSMSMATSGTLTQSNSKANAAIFNLVDMKPGDTVNGKVLITNTGSLPATFGLTETSSTNGFTDSNLKLEITDTAQPGTPIYSGTFGGLDAADKRNLGTFADGESKEFLFKVTLDATTPNGDQAKTANATYTWDAVQVDNGTTFDFPSF